MQNLVVAGDVGQVVAHHKDFLYKIIRAQNFGHKDQVVFDHKDGKKQFSVYICYLLLLLFSFKRPSAIFW